MIQWFNDTIIQYTTKNIIAIIPRKVRKTKYVKDVNCVSHIK